MKLMTKTLERQIPELYAQDGKGDNAIVYAHYFCSDKDWYVTEYDKNSGECFGYVKFYGYPGELGYFSLKQFEEYNNKVFSNDTLLSVAYDRDGVMEIYAPKIVERDLYWNKCKLGDVRREKE